MWYEDEVEDMDTSTGEEEDPENLQAKKRDGSDGGGWVTMQVSLLEHPPQQSASVSPLKEQEKKRPRRDGDGEEN